MNSCACSSGHPGFQKLLLPEQAGRWRLGSAHERYSCPRAPLPDPQPGRSKPISSCLLCSAEGRAGAREAGLEPELPARTRATKSAVAAPSPGEGPLPLLQLIRSPRQGKHSPAWYLTAERGGFDYVWTIEQEHFLLHRGLLWAAHTPGGQRRAWRQQADGWASPLPAGPSGLSLSRL